MLTPVNFPTCGGREREVDRQRDRERTWAGRRGDKEIREAEKE